jgi:hypothetical protein
VWAVICDDDSAIRVVKRGGGLMISERESVFGVVLRSVVGLFLVGVGGLVVLVFLSGALRPVGELPQRMAGWVVVAFIFLALGVLPLGAGFNVALMRERWVANADGIRRERYLMFGGILVWRRRYEKSLFQRASIRLRRLPSVFGGGRWRYVVSLAGARKQTDLAAFGERSDAEETGAAVARLFDLPVIAEDDSG